MKSRSLQDVSRPSFSVNPEALARARYFARLQRQTMPPRCNPLGVVFAVLAVGLVFIGLTMTINAVRLGGSSSVGDYPLKIVGPILTAVGLAGFVINACVMCKLSRRERLKWELSLTDLATERSLSLSSSSRLPSSSHVYDNRARISSTALDTQMSHKPATDARYSNAAIEVREKIIQTTTTTRNIETTGAVATQAAVTTTSLARESQDENEKLRSSSLECNKKNPRVDVDLCRFIEANVRSYETESHLPVPIRRIKKRQLSNNAISDFSKRSASESDAIATADLTSGVYISPQKQSNQATSNVKKRTGNYLPDNDEARNSCRISGSIRECCGNDGFNIVVYGSSGFINENMKRGSYISDCSDYRNDENRNDVYSKRHYSLSDINQIYGSPDSGYRGGQDRLADSSGFECTDRDFSDWSQNVPICHDSQDNSFSPRRLTVEGSQTTLNGQSGINYEFRSQECRQLYVSVIAAQADVVKDVKQSMASSNARHRERSETCYSQSRNVRSRVIESSYYPSTGVITQSYDNTSCETQI